MKRRILIPLDDDEIRDDEIEEINRETRRLEEEAAHAERLREATAARDAAQQRLTAAQYDPQDPITWMTAYQNRRQTADEIISEAFGEPKQEEPKVGLQKVDTAKFVFAWENSSSVEEVVGRLEPFPILHTKREYGIASARKLAEMIRTVENIPLRELPDKRPTIKRGRIQNFS